MGGRARITPALAISDSLRSPLSRRTAQLDYHSKIESELNEFRHRRLRGYWNLNLGFLPRGTNPLCRGRRGRLKSLQLPRPSRSHLFKLFFHLHLKFHPGWLPVSLCLCFDSLSVSCNVFCSE